MIVQDERYREVFESAAEQHANGGVAVDSVTATQRAPSITVVHFGAPTVEDLSRHDDPSFDLTFKIGDYFHTQRVRAHLIHTRFFPCCRVSWCALLRWQTECHPLSSWYHLEPLWSTFRAPRHRCKPFLSAWACRYVEKSIKAKKKRSRKTHLTHFLLACYSRALTTKHVPMMCARMRPAHKTNLQAVSVAKDEEIEPPVSVGGGRHKTGKLHSAGTSSRRHGEHYRAHHHSGTAGVAPKTATRGAAASGQVPVPTRLSGGGSGGGGGGGGGGGSGGGGGFGGNLGLGQEQTDGAAHIGNFDDTTEDSTLKRLLRDAKKDHSDSSSDQRPNKVKWERPRCVGHTVSAPSAHTHDHAHTTRTPTVQSISPCC
jgi:uncharacterized membrane protein YgcG